MSMVFLNTFNLLYFLFHIIHFQVEDAADIQSLMMWADEIVSCGYTNQIKMDSKESKKKSERSLTHPPHPQLVFHFVFVFLSAIVLHSTTRLIPMLQQLRKGMELYGLVNLMAVNPEACHSLFVPGKILKVSINIAASV